MVGSAIERRLNARGYANILTASRDALDLLDQRATREWMLVNRPDVVIIAAARVGGILANSSYPWNFLYENLAIETNLI